MVAKPQRQDHSTTRIQRKGGYLDFYHRPVGGMPPSPAEHTTVMNNLTLPSPSSEGSSYVYPTDTGENELGELNCKPARLVLEDGTEFEGYSFGYHGSVAGELVFNTGM
ncbi:hypothetical protein FOZ62_013940, partial [Perkinsus olseni]